MDVPGGDSDTLGLVRVPSGREMFRSLGLLYVCGGLVALVWLTLPHASDSGNAVITGTAVLAVTMGAVLAVGLLDEAPRWVLHLVLAIVQVLIAVGYVANDQASGDLRWFWVWATPYAAFFFSRPAAAAHTAWMAVLNAVSLVLLDVSAGRALALWLISTCTVAVTAMLVGWAAALVRSSEARLRDLALHDPLTGLANRRLYALRAEEALAERDRSGGSVVVTLVDLDDFKEVNDTYGHETGDELLSVLARRMVQALEPEDVAVRLGGDEFAVISRCDEPEPDVETFAQRISGCWSSPFGLQDGEVWVAGSMGISFSSDPGSSATALLREADAAMYRAKSIGGGVHVVYDERMRAGAHDRMRLDAALRRGLDERQLRLVYQPVADVAERRWHGAEALVRWEHPELGRLEPSAFVALAEETRLVVPIGEWVLREALFQLLDWRRAGVVPETFVMSVNVSPRQLRSDFPASVRSALSDAGLPGSCLAFELTENVLLAESAQTGKVLADLRELGVSLQLDDFGTGYSSLGSLKRVPMDVIKIDRGVVAAATESEQAAAAVSAICAMADALGVPTVAEGVETEAQLELLVRSRCRYAQGHLFASPASGDDTEQVLSLAPPAPSTLELRRRTLDLRRGTRSGSAPDRPQRSDRT